MSTIVSYETVTGINITTNRQWMLKNSDQGMEWMENGRCILHISTKVRKPYAISRVCDKKCPRGLV